MSVDAPAEGLNRRWAGSRPTDILAVARLVLAVVLGLRLALSPFAAAVGQPDALWRPRGTGLLFAAPPPVAVVVALQVVGVTAAAVHVWRRRLGPLVLAWACLLVLAGLRTSLGKILHNDVLLMVAAAPLLLAGPFPSESRRRRIRPRPVPSESPPRRFRPYGSSESPGAPFSGQQVTLRNAGPGSGLLAPLRRWWACSPRAVAPATDDEARLGLDAAAALVLVSYLSAGWWKLLRSGPAWALSDNLRWSLAGGRGGSRWPAATDWLVGQPALCMALAGGILTLELGAPLLWLRPRLTPWFVAAATLMHAGTWLVLGLDYWAHLAAVALVLLPWARMRRR